MRHNVVRVHAVIQDACSTSASHQDALVVASLERWWHCFHVVAKLLGDRQLMCLLREAGALWTLGDNVITLTPRTKPLASVGDLDGRRPQSRQPGRGGGASAASNLEAKPTPEPQATAPTEVVLDEEADAVAALNERLQFKQAVSTMPPLTQRNYTIACLVKVAAFCERCTCDLQEHASTTQQDKLTATLSSTQGLEITSLLDAPIRGMEATADRMFPFRSGREVLYEILRHTAMLQALVLCALQDDQCANQSSDAADGLLGAPPPFFLHDFLVVRNGCRVELLSANKGPATTDGTTQHSTNHRHEERPGGSGNWRVPVVATSLRTVGDGVAMHGGCLGLMATMEDEASHRPRFVRVDQQQLKFLTYAQAPSRGPAPPPPPTTVAPRVEKQQRAAPSTRSSRQGPLPVATTAPNTTIKTTPPVWIVEEVIQDDTDLLGPMRRNTRRVARILNGGGSAPATGDVDSTDDVVIDEGRQRTQMDGAASTSNVGSSGVPAPGRYGAGSDRCTSREQLLATLQMLMCFAVRLTTLAEVPSPSTAKQKEQGDPPPLMHPQGDADQSTPFAYRLVLTSLLVLHTLPADAVHATRMASPEMAWFVVERVVAGAASTPPTIGRIMAAGYALVLVEPAAMALPLWYGLLRMVYQRRITAGGTAAASRSPGTGAAVTNQAVLHRSGNGASLHDLWQLVEQCTFRHPLLPSVMPSGIWAMMEAHAPSSTMRRDGPSRSGTSPNGARGNANKLLVLRSAGTTQRSISPVAAPMSPTLSDVSVVEIDARGFPAAAAGVRGRRRGADAVHTTRAKGATSNHSLVFEDVDTGWMTSRRKRHRLDEPQQRLGGTPPTDNDVAVVRDPVVSNAAKRLEDAYPLAAEASSQAGGGELAKAGDPPHTARDDWMLRCHKLLSSLLDNAAPHQL